jgi:hypothetical protein
VSDELPDADAGRSTLFGAAEAIVVLVASGVSAGGGAQIATVLVGSDAKRAIVGAPLGALALSALLVGLMLVLGRRYRSIGGSPVLVVLASLIVPAVCFFLPFAA